MHPELTRLLQVQEKDTALRAIEAAIDAVREERTALDAALQRTRAAVTAAARAVEDGIRRRDELEKKVESLRVIQERRRQRMEQVKTAREAQALTAELDLARSIIAKEESDWVRAAEQVTALERSLAEVRQALEEAEGSQQEARTALDGREAELAATRQAAKEERDEAAGDIDRPLMMRYDRLRTARSTEVIVAMHGAACGACYTTVPMNRRTQIKTGIVIEGCEACGVLLYTADETA